MYVLFVCVVIQLTSGVLQKHNVDIDAVLGVLKKSYDNPDMPEYVSVTLSIFNSVLLAFDNVTIK